MRLMPRFLIAAVWLLLSGLALPAQTPAWFVSRTQVATAYEPHRSFVVWKSTPFAYASVTLTNGAVGTVPCEMAELVGQQWYDRYHALVTVPTTTPAGNYQLLVNGATTGVTITVSPKVPRAPAVTLSPSNIEKLESVAPYSDVTLNPGLYTLKRSLALPPGVRIYGYGAVVQTALPRGTGGAYEQLFFWPPTDDLAFHGITFLPANHVIYGSDTQWNNLHFANCTFRPATLYMAGVGRHSSKNAVYSGCTFERVMTTISGGLVLDCTWKGMVAPRGEAHSLFVDGGKSLCVARAKFDGTDRGPILGDSLGDVTGVLFTDLDLRNINRVDNGNELILLESRANRPYTQCVFHRGRVTGCSGNINLWNGKLSASQFNDWLLDDATIVFAGFAPQTGNTVANCEFRGGGLLFANAATGNTVQYCAFLGWRNTRRNQVMAAPFWYDPAAPRPAYITLPVPSSPITVLSDANRPVKSGLITHKLADNVQLETMPPATQ